MNQIENKKQKRMKIMIAVLALITVAAVSVSVWALFFRGASVVLTPDYAPQEEEKNAVAIENDTKDKMEAEEGGGAVSLTYGSNVSIILSNKTATLLFANPGKSTQDMVVQVVIQDTVLVQSGRLTPGNQVTTLDLLDGVADMLSPGGYEGKFVVLYYNRDSGEKAIVNTEIPVTISVVE